MVGILKEHRTEEGKAIRRMYGDASGMCKYNYKYKSPEWGGVSNTITTVIKHDIVIMNASRDEIINAIDNLAEDEVVRIRKFTPREVLRLMGVPDEKIDIMLSSGVSNSQLYKQAGNSIVVDNMVSIFDALIFPKRETREPMQLEINFDFE